MRLDSAEDSRETGEGRSRKAVAGQAETGEEGGELALSSRDELRNDRNSIDH